jgi:hypothetical protein
MARRPTIPERHSANLNAEQIERAIPRLQKRIEDLERFNPYVLTSRSAPEVVSLRAAIEGTLGDIFGPNSHEYHRYRSAAVFDGGPVMIVRGVAPDLRFREYHDQSRKRAIALLQQAIAGLREQLAFAEPSDEPSEEGPYEPEPKPLQRRIFVVHGHQDGPREAVARFLEKIGFEAVILHERPNKGRALITKFQDEAAGIGFAVVIMTGDDVGGPVDGNTQPRARQNVIFELGFFIGALGPARVAAIVASGVERPSDFEGVVYIPLDGEWKTTLARELKATGYEIDWNKVMD